ncbi:uncharacterized protein Z518_05712 [Rhinocladiella mackenziei CBS 650.93]|uniref:Rhinocladiella mackenziei CBS 650.93 unplaced genomic scaffold supercont1.4, whole genome shotgun sequence n=1 Tax=Rhinocladiella mackenziei CBS 650.93 TaxID=1442369 RepID=A0A0D2INX8_9EURO|nr:uncharacterized protein Z518_05712 [Rhinocladiella mackenziei CBS 650.93]KIX04841.1 hypothetical protein Z518_05712 [Rhinocladiella mackenziei CBS 650.93]
MVRLQIITETKARVEERLKHYNPVIPQHRQTILCSRFILRKLDFVTRLQWFLFQRPGPREDFATEENLAEALEILGPRLFNEEDLLKQFAWARKAYPQYHVMMYILWHLCIKPEGPNIERAWEAVETLSFRELWDESTQGFGSKSAVLAALETKAVFVRKKIETLNPEGNTRNSESHSALVSGEAGQGASEDEVHWASLLGDMGCGELDFDVAIDEWPNWATIVQSFQPDGQIFPGILPQSW